MKTRRVAICGLVGLVLTVAGCSATAGQSASATGSAGQADFQVATPDGEASLTLDGHLPPNWPSGIPIPEPAQVAGSGKIDESGAADTVAVYSTLKPAPDTFTFYTSSNAIKGTYGGVLGYGSAYRGRLRFTAPYPGSVTVVTHGGRTYIVIVLTNLSATTTSG